MSKRWWPLKPKLVTTNVIRSVFIDPESGLTIVGFDSDQFLMMCVLEADKMYVSCASKRYRLDLASHIIGFSVFCELEWLERQDNLGTGDVRTSNK